MYMLYMFLRRRIEARIDEIVSSTVVYVSLSVSEVYF